MKLDTKITADDGRHLGRTPALEAPLLNQRHVRGLCPHCNGKLDYYIDATRLSFRCPFTACARQVHVTHPELAAKRKASAERVRIQRGRDRVLMVALVLGVVLTALHVLRLFI